MKPETIKAIFTNLLFVIGVLFTIVGFIQGTRTVVKLVVFDKYPLDTWAETRCDQPPYAPVPVDGGKYTPEEMAKLPEKNTCLTSLEYDRKVKVTEDIVASVSFLIAGATLIFFFRRFILK